MEPAPNQKEPVVSNYYTALFEGHQDHERIEGLHEIHAKLDDDDFWFLFRNVIGNARILFPHTSLLRDMLSNARYEAIDRFDQHSEECLKTWRERIRRGKPIKVYRGCASHNLVGWSWTTNKQIAQHFAIGTGRADACVSVGRIDPHAITIIPEVKNFHEVFAYPERVKFSHQENFPARPDDEKKAQLRQLVITGLPAEAHVKRLAHKIFNGEATVDFVCDGFQKESDYLRALGFEKRPAFLEEIIRKLRESESARTGQADAVPPQAERIEGN